MVDADRVVSRITLLDEELSFAVPGTDEAVRLPTGRVELVATLPEYEGRGLVRALQDQTQSRVDLRMPHSPIGSPNCCSAASVSEG